MLQLLLLYCLCIIICGRKGHIAYVLLYVVEKDILPMYYVVGKDTYCLCIIICGRKGHIAFVLLYVVGKDKYCLCIICGRKGHILPMYYYMW